MNQLTLTLMKVAFLAVLWLFVIAAVGVIRADLWGSKAAAKALRPRKAAQRAHVEVVRILRVDHDPADPPRILQPHVFPRLAAID